MSSKNNINAKKAFTRNKTSVPISSHHSTGSPSQSNQTRKNKDSNWKEEVKLLLLADDVVLFTENPKDSSRKLPEIINE